MAIDLERDKLISAAEAAKLLPSYRDGKPTHVSRVIRLFQAGSPMPDGTRDRSEALRYMGQWVTTARALREHGERVSAAWAAHQRGGPPATTSTTRRRSAERAARELDAIGI